MEAMYILQCIEKPHDCCSYRKYCGLGLIKNNNSLKNRVVKKKKNRATHL